MGDLDALHAARAVIGGRPLNLTTDEVFARLNDCPAISPKDTREARRIFDAIQLGIAVEAVEKAADRKARLSALLHLARALCVHLKDRRPGWFRFLLAFGGQQGDSTFRLSVTRRPHSSAAQPRYALNRVTQTRRALSDMLVAGSILSRIEVATADGKAMPVQAAIEAAINEGDIATEEEAARGAFQRFRKSCAQLTDGGDTYRLERYVGPIERHKGRWVALPEIGSELSRLPSDKGGRPKT